MTKKSTPKNVYPYVEDRYDLEHVSAKRAILIGNATFISMREASLEKFVALKPRNSVSAIASLFVKNPPRVFFYVSEDILKMSPSNMQFAYANDAYISWGFKTKGKVILFGGSSKQNQTNLQIFFFENGALVSTEEKTIPGHYNLQQYTDTAASVIDQLIEEDQSYKVYYAAPLVRFGEALNHIEYIDESIFKSLQFQSLQVAGDIQEKISLFPMVIAVCGLLVYVGAVGKGWTTYQESISAFDTAMADPIVKESGGVGGGLIETIQKQRFFMQETKGQIALAQKTRSIVNALSKLNDVRVRDLTTKVGSSTAVLADSKDIRIVISVPTTSRLALDQAKEILETISMTTGLSLHMARQGWKDLEKRREFTFEGNFNE